MNLCFLRHAHNLLHELSLLNDISLILKSSLECWVLHSSICNVVLNGIVEEDAILRHNGNLVSQITDLNVLNVLSINQYLSLTYIIESIKKSHDS
jgi:hypothetical protein